MVRTLLTGVMVVAGSIVALAPTPQVAALDDTPWTLPVPPERCTVEQAESGDVADCLLAFWQRPSETGFGVPPAPGVGEGWEWIGYTYSGSPALEEWESTYIVENSEPLAGRGPGWMETHVAAQPLFEGFLDEITRNGYEVRHASGYSFRCTNGSGGWSCPSGDPGGLSLHAWGLAVDMNSDANPIRRYDGIDGATACATPMETDMPRWMIRTAEKWGLYWGGYGWSSGCTDTTTQRTSVFRDPPHFEFRGTPSQARAIAAFNLGDDPTLVCIDVVDEDGQRVERCNRSGKPQSGWRLPVEVDAPAGATAAVINLTATEPDSHGYLTLEDCAPRSGERETSALTYAPGQSVATMAVVPLSDEGGFCVYRKSSAHTIVDVVGFLGADGEPLWFDPSPPTRLTDTRLTGSCTPRQDCTEGRVGDRTEHIVPTDEPGPRIANLVAIEGSGPGFLQAGRCGSLGAARDYSNLNYMNRDVRSNLALVDGGEEGTCVFALRSAHVIVDELGSLSPDEGYGWLLDAPRRAIDTRECGEQWCEVRPEAGQVIPVDLGTDAPAAAIAITATETQAPGYIWVGDCAHMEGRTEPATSNLNHVRGQTVTNLALVELREGAFCVYTRSSAHVIIDVQAELTTERTLGLLPVEPHRPHDSRLLRTDG